VYVSSVTSVVNDGRCCLDLLSRFSSFTLDSCYSILSQMATWIEAGQREFAVQNGAGRLQPTLAEYCPEILLLGRILCSQQRKSGAVAIPTLGTATVLVNGWVDPGWRSIGSVFYGLC